MRRWNVLAGIILVLIGISMFFSESDALGKNVQSLDRKWSFAPGELQQLKVRSDYDLELSFVKSTDGTNTVSLKGQGEENLVKAVNQIELTNGTLDVELRAKRWQLFNIFNMFDDTGKKVIVVALNDDAELEQLKLKLSSGSLSTQDVTAKKVDIELSSGHVELENLNADQFQLRVSSGKIRANGIHAESDIQSSSGSIRLEGLTGVARVKSSSGSVRIVKEDTADLDVKSSSGSVHIRMPSSFAGFYDLQTSSGSIRAPESKRLTNDLVKVRASSGSVTIEQD